MNSPPTATTVGVKESGYPTPSRDQARLQSRYMRIAAQRAFETSTPTTVRLRAPDVINVSPFASWLPLIERRINDSIIPKEYESLSFAPTEWLREEVGQTAIRFFQSAADILPGEPFLYASLTGALVAEFKPSNGALTAIISPDAITLFAVKADDPDAPVELTLRRDTNRLREELKQIVQSLVRSHGQMGTAG